MNTTFIHTRVPIGLGIHDGAELHFVIDGNSKITAGNGSYSKPAPNALSFPAASVEGPGKGPCPGSTAICRSTCYVRGLASAVPEQYAAYKENEATLALLLSLPAWALLEAADALGAWITHNASAGFRWHVSGDVYENPGHARFIRHTCHRSQGVRHWIYTRTFAAVPELIRASNLTVNVSADAENYSEAFMVATRYRCRIAYEATGPGDIPRDLPAGSVIFPDYPLRGRSLPIATDAPWWHTLTHAGRSMVCPADFFGQSEQHRCGPCDKCIRPAVSS
jgi:hypothetical protein